MLEFLRIFQKMADDLTFISENIPYEKVREYLIQQGVAKPGKGMRQMLNTIQESDDSARFISELKKVFAFMSSEDKKLAKRKATQRKPVGPGYRKKGKSVSTTSIIGDDDEEDNNEDEDDDEDVTMQRLKESLALRGKTTIGNSYPRLVKRLLDALDDENEADESDDD